MSFSPCKFLRIFSGEIIASNVSSDSSVLYLSLIHILPELVDNLLTLTKPAIDEHKHQLEVKVEHIEHEAVCGDSLHIQQIFVNLMSNAVKYTPDGGNITLTIKEKSCLLYTSRCV